MRFYSEGQGGIEQSRPVHVDRGASPVRQLAQCCEISKWHYVTGGRLLDEKHPRPGSEHARLAPRRRPRSMIKIAAALRDRAKGQAGDSRCAARLIAER